MEMTSPLRRTAWSDLDAVDGQQGAGFGLANQIPPLARDLEVAGPNSRLFQGQVRPGRATDLHGQAGGGELGAAFFPERI